MAQAKKKKTQPKRTLWSPTLLDLLRDIVGVLEALPLPTSDSQEQSFTLWTTIPAQVAPLVQRLQPHLERARGREDLEPSESLVLDRAEALGAHLGELGRAADARGWWNLHSLRATCRDLAREVLELLGEEAETEFVLRVTDVAEILGVDKSYVSRLCNEGRLESRGEGRGRRVSRSSVEHFICERRRRAEPRTEREVHELAALERATRHLAETGDP